MLAMMMLGIVLGACLLITAMEAEEYRDERDVHRKTAERWAALYNELAAKYDKLKENMYEKLKNDSRSD